MVSTVSILAIVLTVVFLCFSLTDTLKMIRKQCVTKLCSLFKCCDNGVQVSLPYKRVGIIAALNILSLVDCLTDLWYQRILQSLLKLLDALRIRTLISLSRPQTNVTMLPRYSNSSTTSTGSSAFCNVALLGASCWTLVTTRILVLRALTERPISLQLWSRSSSI